MSFSSSKWPSFYIVGAAKAGTTSLYEKLRNHPQVFFPWMKEPNYFLSVAPPAARMDRISPHCFNQPEKYLALYSDAEQYKATGDASVTYLWDKESPARIFQVRPEARIIIMLRDPIARAQSHYYMLRKLGLEPETNFLSALQQSQVRDKSHVWTGSLYIEFGLYYEQVKRYLDTFGREQVLVILTDELNKRPRETFEVVQRHIGVEHLASDAHGPSNIYNAYAMPRFPGLYRFASQKLFSPELRRKYLPAGVREFLRASSLFYDKSKPQIDDSARAFLQSIYEPDVTRLERLLDRDLSLLKKSWRHAEALTSSPTTKV